MPSLIIKFGVKIIVFPPETPVSKGTGRRRKHAETEQKKSFNTAELILISGKPFFLQSFLLVRMYRYDHNTSK